MKKTFINYEQAKTIVHTYQLNSSREWDSYKRNKILPGIPSEPDK
jgi:hypothetical protein